MEESMIKNVAENFIFEGNFVSFIENNSGNINKTFVLTYDNQGKTIKYTLQKLNTYVFKNPHQVMDNILKVSQHLKNKLIEVYGDYDRRVLEVILSKEGQPYYESETEGFWRAFVYVDNARAYNSVETPSQFFSAGKAFGEFQKLLADFDASTLYETIKDFHNTPKRMETFFKAVAENKAGRKASVEKEINFIKERSDEAVSILNMIENGQIPLRVTHNDTKFNNVLIDDTTGEGLCVIDLDTVMPGTSLYDFGDAVRSGASTAPEDEKDLSKVSFDLELFELFTKGFIESTDGFLTDTEITLLPLGAKIITLELAVRFLSDYLDGDLYFKTNYPEHNLDRTRTQLKLVSDIESKFDKMNEIVMKYKK